MYNAFPIMTLPDIQMAPTQQKVNCKAAGRLIAIAGNRKWEEGVNKRLIIIIVHHEKGNSEN